MSSKPIITVFKNSPDEGAGLARDMRVRWALEEVSVPYDVRPVSLTDLKDPDYLALHPFGQIPVYWEGGLVLFESGAIVLHIAEHYPGLLPEDPDDRWRTITWMFAALNTVEPPIVDREVVEYFESDKPWQQERFAMVEERIRRRLDQLAAFLGDADWLHIDFSAADILMVHVLRRLEDTPILDDYPTLSAYIARARARPAYQRAFDAQLSIFTENQPTERPEPSQEQPASASASVFTQSFLHGTKADLKPGDHIVAGFPSNFLDAGNALSWSYFSATMDAAIWGAELAKGEGRERIYVVEPTGEIEDDPNLTDKKFPGNPSMSYRSREPLKIIAEVSNWQGHSPDQVRQMKDNLARLKADGQAEIID